mmetsp:Transcript_176573/g.566133  ORF Transcript_176573/g.566133 Transcript_176573/m.566133 type:complete len:288 (+) Transcript_176573:2497-3360(+)
MGAPHSRRPFLGWPRVELVCLDAGGAGRSHALALGCLRQGLGPPRRDRLSGAAAEAARAGVLRARPLQAAAAPPHQGAGCRELHGGRGPVPGPPEPLRAGPRLQVWLARGHAGKQLLAGQLAGPQVVDFVHNRAGIAGGGLAQNLLREHRGRSLGPQRPERCGPARGGEVGHDLPGGLVVAAEVLLGKRGTGGGRQIWTGGRRRGAGRDDLHPRRHAAPRDMPGPRRRRRLSRALLEPLHELHRRHQREGGCGQVAGVCSALLRGGQVARRKALVGPVQDLRSRTTT